MKLLISVSCDNCAFDSHVSSLREWEEYRCPKCHSSVDKLLYETDAIILIEGLHRQLMECKNDEVI
jgi:Zn finger protein HypA/HybF involved in hydrogenase expression